MYGTPGLTVTSRQNTFLPDNMIPQQPAGPSAGGGFALGGTTGAGYAPGVGGMPAAAGGMGMGGLGPLGQSSSMPLGQLGQTDIPGMMTHRGIGMGGGSGGVPGTDPYSFIKANYSHADEAGSTRKIWEEGQRRGWTNDQMGAGLGFTGQQVQDHFAKYGLGGASPPGPGSMPGNPNLGGIADDITRRTQGFLDQNTRSNALRGVLAGGYGDSGWGMAQGKSLSTAADNLAGQLAGLYGNAWNQDQDRGLQRHQGDQRFVLGAGDLGLRRYQGDQQFTLGAGGLANQQEANRLGFYTNERAQDRADRGQGAEFLSAGLGMPWGPLQNSNDIYASYSGLGPSSATGSQGGGWQGALGGALGAAQLGRNFGWWGR